MFKRGDFIKVKPNTKLESGDIVNDWTGEIHKVYSEEKTCFVILDAPTINSLEDEILISCIKQGVDPFEYIFSFDDIAIAEKRGTFEEELDALDKLADRVITLEDKLRKN
jgi:hypothetical protein